MNFHDMPWDAVVTRFVPMVFTAQYQPALNNYNGGYVFDETVKCNTSPIFRLGNLYFFDSINWTCNVGSRVFQYLTSTAVNFGFQTETGTYMTPSDFSLQADGLAQDIKFPWLCSVESTNSLAHLRATFGNSPDLLEYPTITFSVEMKIYDIADVLYVDEFQQRGFAKYCRNISENVQTRGKLTQDFHSHALFEREV